MAAELLLAIAVPIITITRTPTITIAPTTIRILIPEGLPVAAVIATTMAITATIANPPVDAVVKRR